MSGNKTWQEWIESNHKWWGIQQHLFSSRSKSQIYFYLLPTWIKSNKSEAAKCRPNVPFFCFCLIETEDRPTTVALRLISITELFFLNKRIFRQRRNSSFPVPFQFQRLNLWLLLRQTCRLFLKPKMWLGIVFDSILGRYFGHLVKFFEPWRS